MRPKATALGASILLALGLGAPGAALFAGAAGASTHNMVHSSCSAYKAGKNGVICTFCTGKATATVTMGSTTTVTKGGTCGKSGNSFTVNAGVVTSPTYKGHKPNYFGLDVPPNATSFSNAILSFTVGGTNGYGTTNSGTVTSNHKSGTFTGTDLEGKTFRGSFTC